MISRARVTTSRSPRPIGNTAREIFARETDSQQDENWCDIQLRQTLQSPRTWIAKIDLQKTMTIVPIIITYNHRDY